MTEGSTPHAKAVRFRCQWTIISMMHPPERRTMDCDRLTLPEIPVPKERPPWFIHPALQGMESDKRISSDRLHSAGYQTQKPERFSADDQISDGGTHQHAFLCSNIQHSTFHHSLKRMVPLSLQNGKRFASFPFLSILIVTFS